MLVSVLPAISTPSRSPLPPNRFAVASAIARCPAAPVLMSVPSMSQRRRRCFFIAAIHLLTADGADNTDKSREGGSWEQLYGPHPCRPRDPRFKFLFRNRARAPARARSPSDFDY